MLTKSSVIYIPTLVGVGIVTEVSRISGGSGGGGGGGNGGGGCSGGGNGKTSIKKATKQRFLIRTQ